MAIVRTRTPAGKHPVKTAVRYARGERIGNLKPLLEHLAHCEQCNDMVVTIQEFISGLREEGRLIKERPSVEAVFKKAGFDRASVRQMLLQPLRQGPSSQK